MPEVTVILLAPQTFIQLSKMRFTEKVMTTRWFDLDSQVMFFWMFAPGGRPPPEPSKFKNSHTLDQKSIKFENSHTSGHQILQ